MNTQFNSNAITLPGNRVAGRALMAGLLALASLALTTQSAKAQLVIDNFTTGKVKMEGKPTASFANQTGTGILGGNRTIIITPNYFGTNEFAQPVQVEVQPGIKKVPSALLLSNGYNAFPRVDVLYGPNGDNESAPPLNLDMTPYQGGFNLDFAGVSNQLDFFLTVWDVNGASANANCNVVSAESPSAFTLNASIANFSSVDLSNISLIDVTLVAANIYGTPNLAITQISAVSNPGTGVVTCGTATN